MFSKLYLRTVIFAVANLVMLAGLAQPALAQDGPTASGAINLSVLGTYETGLIGDSAA